MKETTPARTSHGGELNSPPLSLAMRTCFDRWCKKFDDLLRTKGQKAVRGEGALNNLIVETQYLTVW